MRISLAACLLLAAFGLARGQNPARPGAPSGRLRGENHRQQDRKSQQRPRLKTRRRNFYLVAGGGTVAIPVEYHFRSAVRPSRARQASFGGISQRRRGEGGLALSRARADAQLHRDCHNATSRKNSLILQTPIRQTRKYAEADALLNSLNFGDNKEAPLCAPR